MYLEKCSGSCRRFKRVFIWLCNIAKNTGRSTWRPKPLCNAVKEELAKLDKAQAEIDSKKGVTGTNVAAAIFWLPGLAYTYYDAGEATRFISDRKRALTTIYNNKNCTS